MRALIHKYLFLFLVFAGLMSQAIAYASESDFPPVPNPPRLVNDLAGFMSQSDEQRLEEKLRAYTDSTSNEIAIVTVQSIGQYDISDYTVQLFNKWHIGGKKNNNGILILASMEERKIWISTGYGLEGVLPDGLVGEIIRNEMEPEFKAGNFALGFDQAINAIVKASQGEYKAEPKQIRGKHGAPPVAIIIIIVIVLIIFSRNGGRGGGGGLMNNIGWIAASMLSDNGRSSGGGGWGGGSSGGGGFGGFGGGSSGGGGAGGSW